MVSQAAATRVLQPGSGDPALFFHKDGEPIPSNYTAYGDVLSAVRKDKTSRWSRQNLTLQRGRLAARCATRRGTDGTHYFEVFEDAEKWVAETPNSE